MHSRSYYEQKTVDKLESIYYTRVNIHNTQEHLKIHQKMTNTLAEKMDKDTA